MPEPAAEGFVTVSEAARALQLSERQVRRYAGRLTESDRLPAQNVRPTPDATTGSSPARVRLSALALLAGKVIAEESTPEKASGSMPEVTGSSPAPAGHDDRLPAESVRPVSGVASGPLVSEDLATLREQLASVTAERDGLTARLADAQKAALDTASDRDAWKEQAQTLTEALRAAQDEARAARLIGGRPMQQIEALGAPAGDSGASEVPGGASDTPNASEEPKRGFWARLRGR